MTKTENKYLNSLGLEGVASKSREEFIIKMRKVYTEKEMKSNIKSAKKNMMDLFGIKLK